MLHIRQAEAWLTLSSVLGGCTKKSPSEVGDATPSECQSLQAAPDHAASLNGQVLPGLNDINLSGRGAGT